MYSLLGTALALLLAAALASMAWAAADRLLGAAPPRARIAATATIALWWMVTLFEVTARLGHFQLVVVLPIQLAACAIAWSGADPDRLRGDLASIRDILGDTGWLTRLAAIPLAALVAFFFCRGFALPPLGWDSLSYHLVHAARWVQAGAFQPEAAPYAWGYFEYFPYDGEVPWAWAMLPYHADDAVALVALLVCCAIGGAAAALARELGAGREQALLAGLIAMFTPAVIRASEVAYVDTQVEAYFLLGALFVVRFLRAPSAASAALACAPLALALGVKLNTAPLAAVGVGAMALRLLVADAPWAARAGWVVSGFLPSLSATPAYIRLLVVKHSPTWPNALSLGPWQVPADPAWIAYQDKPGKAVFQLMKDQFYEGGVRTPTHLNLGPATAVLALLALVAIAQKRDRASAYLLATWIAFTGLCLTTGAQRFVSSSGSGRFLLPWAAIAIVTGSRLVPVPVLVALLFVQFSYDMPVVRDADGMAALEVALRFGIGLAIGAALVWAAARAQGRPLAIAAGLVVAIVTGGVVSEYRATQRYPMYVQSMNKHHPLSVRRTLSRVCITPGVWKYLDDGPPHRVAYQSTWTGHGWYRYPGMGRYLQNSLIYVPPTTDGSILSDEDDHRLKAAFDRDAWFRRLADWKMEYVLTGYPSPIERKVIESLPQCFTLATESNGHQLFKIDYGSTCFPGPSPVSAG
jgi:hypothetical protein